MNYSDYQAEDARLVILKELVLQLDGRLNEANLEKVLDAFGYRRPRAWIKEQLREMERLGAIAVYEAGSVLVAEITRAGLEHVNLRAAIAGIALPTPGA